VSGIRLGINDLLPVHLDAKPSRVDVHVTFNDGEAADLEMQIDKTEDDLRDRAAFYAAMLHAVQSRKGHAYKEIKRVYQVFFLNCILYPQSDKMPRCYYYMEEEEHDRLTEISEIIFYEMPKLEQKVRDILAGKADMESLREDEKWCIFMRYRHEDRAARVIEKLYQEEGIMRAEKAVKAIDRDYWKAARKMAELKNSMDEAQKTYDLREKIRGELREEFLREGRQEVITLLKSGKSAEEIIQLMENESENYNDARPKRK
jgi:predicted transposase/invertase (TIGR01784 family)